MATLPHRERPYLERVRALLPGWAELVLDDSAGCLGLKRQKMLLAARGEYVAVLDDDDDISDNYFKRIKTGINKGVDVVCVSINRHEDGVFKHIQRFGVNNPYKGHQMYAGHFCAVKTVLALKSGYRAIGEGEDADHIMGLQDHIKTALYVKEPLINQYYVSREKEYHKYPGQHQVSWRALSGNKAAV